MTRLEFETVKFSENEEKIIVTLYNLFEFEISKEEFKTEVITKKDTLILDMDESEAKNLFNRLFNLHLPELKNKINKNPAIFIYRNSGIPLIGNLSFGIVDRGTNILEIKPITGCNINCIFCSVDEGTTTRKITDYVIEREYLVQELNKVLNEKNEPMDIWINTQGEATLYSELIGLIKDLNNLKLTNKIVLITNGTLLSKKIIEDLKNAGLNQLNFSINAINSDNAKKIAGCKGYNTEKVQEAIDCAIKCELDVTLTPVYMKKINEKDIEDIIEFTQKVGCKKIHIQNFLHYRLGRNPTKEASWEEFKTYLKNLEQKYPKIEFFAKDHTLKITKHLKKPFRKGDFVQGIIVCLGRYENERIAASQGRNITLQECKQDIGKKVQILITGDKDNTFYGTIFYGKIDEKNNKRKIRKKY